MLLIITVFYPFHLFKSSVPMCLCCGVIVTISSIDVPYLGIVNDLQFESDRYGTWTILTHYGFSSILSWELWYQIINKTKAR